MSTYKQFAERFIDVMKIGFYGTGSARTTTTFTDVTEFQNANLHGSEFKNWWLECAAIIVGTDGGLADDRVKSIKEHAPTTGVVTLTGANYGNTTTQFGFRATRPEWHPLRVILPLANRGLERAGGKWRTILSEIPNADFEATTIGGTDSNATGSRSTTAANVWQGAAAGRVANSGANGYHLMANFDAMAGRQFILTGEARIAVGTAQVRVYDGSNAVEVAAQTFTGVGQPHYFQIKDSWPATCYIGQVRVGGVGATADVYYDDLALYTLPVTRINAPSWLTQIRDPKTGASLVRLYRQRNRLVDSTASGDGTSGPAKAYDLELIPPDDWQLFSSPGAANPLYFEFGKEISEASLPIIIEATRPFIYNDAGTPTGAVSLDADTTACPVDLWVAATRLVWAEENNRPELALWQHEYDLLANQLEGQLAQPPPHRGQVSGFAIQRIR